MSHNTPVRYQATRITLALGTGVAVVAGGLFLATNGSNGTSNVIESDTSALVTSTATSTSAATAAATATPATKHKDDDDDHDSEESSSKDTTSAATSTPVPQATAQPTVSTQKSRVSRGS